LKAIKSYIKQFWKLVKFFKSSKQSQRHDQVQIDLAQCNKINDFTENLSEIKVNDDDLETIKETEFKILHTVNNIKT